MEPLEQGLLFERTHSDILVALNDQGLWSISRDVEPTIIGYDTFGVPNYSEGGRVHTLVDQRQLLSALTPDEANVLLGYCSHVCEHSSAHISITIEALGFANVRKDWEQVLSLSEQIYRATEQMLTADETARTVLSAVRDIQG